MILKSLKVLIISALATLSLSALAGANDPLLINLKVPLKEGDRFPVWLRFENSGEREVTVWVQRPKGASSDHHHKH